MMNAHFGFTNLNATLMTMVIVITIGFFESFVYGKMIESPYPTGQETPIPPAMEGQVLPDAKETDANNIVSIR